jgi:hypothetical protein
MNAHRIVRRARGIALPVMLILLAVMLVSSLYLLRASTSTTLTTANMAYDSALSKAADFGVLAGSDWLAATARANKEALNQSDARNGYVATFIPGQGVNDAAFWVGAVTVTDSQNNEVQYVIHRMCSLAARWDSATNRCTQTAANTSTLNNSVALGDSLASDAQAIADAPQIHYVVTARIFGPRGGNVVNQAVIMIGA